jgi:hypothetical protein
MYDKKFEILINECESNFVNIFKLTSVLLQK